MGARVIVVTSGKGGVGKTTTTANIGTALANLGEKVVLIDADIGLRNLDLILGLENRIVYDIVDVVEERCKLKQALIRDKKQNSLALLPAPQTRDKSAVTPQQMIDVCKELENDFDFILIDCPAGIEQGFQNATAAATEALIVTNPEVSSIRDADRIVGLLESSPNEVKKHLIVNRIRPEMVKQNEMLNVDDVQEILGIDLIGVVPDDESIIRTANKGTLAVNLEESLAGQALKNIARRIKGEDVPFLKLFEEEKGFIASIKRLFGRK
ncbi:MAG: septum site-determining protein MinD [Candidatus Sericytochromatia bacterium]